MQNTGNFISQQFAEPFSHESRTKKRQRKVDRQRSQIDNPIVVWLLKLTPCETVDGVTRRGMTCWALFVPCYYPVLSGYQVIVLICQQTINKTYTFTLYSKNVTKVYADFTSRTMSVPNCTVVQSDLSSSCLLATIHSSARLYHFKIQDLLS